MVVLATGMVPTKNNLTNIRYNNNGFISNPDDGIYSAACAKKPQDVSASVKDSTGIALKAIQTMLVNG